MRSLVSVSAAQEKATYFELQETLTTSSRELQMTTGKLKQRSRDGQASEITLQALTELPDQTRVHVQVGKAFVLHPLSSVRDSLQKRSDEHRREALALAEKKTHLEAKVKQLEQDTQEFIQAHLKRGGGEGK